MNVISCKVNSLSKNIVMAANFIFRRTHGFKIKLGFLLNYQKLNIGT